MHAERHFEFESPSAAGIPELLTWPNSRTVIEAALSRGPCSSSGPAFNTRLSRLYTVLTGMSSLPSASIVARGGQVHTFSLSILGGSSIECGYVIVERIRGEVDQLSSALDRDTVLRPLGRYV